MKHIKIILGLIFLFQFVKVNANNEKKLKWQFPITRTHAGMLLGNSVQGLMVWGVDTLNISIGHAGFWDHRGGNNFIERINFNKFKDLVETGNEMALRKAFRNPEINGVNFR
ncbi:MAG TPA: hypothetical protein VFQ86_08585, partial [Arachidicoccus soli]|nr:hypothetical protein [Arachidicoccus soli]